jgi:hypothetical protein
MSPKERGGEKVCSRPPRPAEEAGEWFPARYAGTQAAVWHTPAQDAQSVHLLASMV